MRRERLKDQIGDPRVSGFDTLVRAVVVLITLGAVYYALSGRGYPFRSKPTANETAPASDPITVTVTRNHTYYWNREGPFALGDFGPRLTTWRRTVGKPQLVITAEESALLSDALQLVNETRHQGVANVRLEGQSRAIP